MAHRATDYLLGAFLLISAAEPVIADPVRAVFDIQVVSRTTELGGTAEPFNATFALTMTFDDTVRFTSEDCCFGSVQFGDATAGGIGVENYGIPTNVLPYDNHGTSGFWGAAEDGTFYRGLSLGIDLSYDPEIGGTGLNAFTLGVFGLEHGLTSKPTLDPRSLLHTVRRGEFENFYLRTSRTSEDGELLYRDYHGYATFAGDDAAPVPEPLSVVLVGTGLVVGVARRRRKGCQG